MKLTRRIIFCTIIAVGVGTGLFSASPASAQTGEDEVLREIDLARKSGVSISDQEVERILSSYRQQSSRALQMQEELQWQNATSGQGLDRPVSRIKGKDGIPFPKPEEVVFKPPPTATPGVPVVGTPEPDWSPEPYVRPTRCERNETTRIEHTPDGDDTKTYLDYLFVSEDLVPIDVGEVYGGKVSLIPYGPHEEKGTFVRMKIYRVPCVPYRMRTTGKADYVDTGLNALKNYDTNPSGKGSLHPFVSQKLYPEKYGRREPPRPRRR